MKNSVIQRSRGLMLAILASVALVGCGSNSDFKSPSFTLGGTASGLISSASVQLSTSAGDTVTVSQNGAFQFPTAVSLGSRYAVTVAQQPASQTCTVMNGSGSVSTAVTDIAVNCVTNGYTISGAVTGLDASTQVTLNNNGADPVVVSADGNFSFPTLAQAYAVTVAQQPTGKYCLVSSGSGTASADVSNVSVSCIAATGLECPAGQALSGIQGRSGAIIDQLEILCANMVGPAVDSATTSAAGFAGGNGGFPFGPFACPAGEWISGITGANGQGGFPTAMASVQATCSGGSQSPSFNFGGITPFAYSCPTGKRATGFVISAVGGYTGFMQGVICEP